VANVAIAVEAWRVAEEVGTNGHVGGMSSAISHGTVRPPGGAIPLIHGRLVTSIALNYCTTPGEEVQS
jgi:hypothetical protein